MAHPTQAQVYRITNNIANDIQPKILVDKNGLVYCFWKSNEDTLSNVYRIRYAMFDNDHFNTTYTGINLTTTTNFYFDVDIDRDNNIWLALLRDGTTIQLAVKKSNELEFQEVAISIVNFIEPGPAKITLAALDSSSVFIGFPYSHEIAAQVVLRYTGKNVVPQSVISCVICEYYNVISRKAFKSEAVRAFFFFRGQEDLHDGGLPAYDYDGLGIFSDSTARFIYTHTTNVIDGGSTNNGQRSLVYFLKSLSNSSLEIEVLDSLAEKSLIRYSNFTAVQPTVSEQGRFLAIVWAENDRLFAKALEDSIAYESIAIDDELFSTYPFNSSIVVAPDSFPNLWLGWHSNTLDSNNEIYVARAQVGTNVDDALVGVEQDPMGTQEHPVFELSQNFPNPFNPTTRIQFDIGRNTFMTVKVFNVFGQEIETLIAQEMQAGKHTFNWIPRNLSSGLYFVRFQTSEFSKGIKVLYLK